MRKMFGVGMKDRRELSVARQLSRMHLARDLRPADLKGVPPGGGHHALERLNTTRVLGDKPLQALPVEFTHALKKLRQCEGSLR